MDSSLFTCPKCKDQLSLHGKTLVCANKHAYDQAREGYVNLDIGGKSVGASYTAEMLRARDEFLSQGFYTPFLDEVESALRAVSCSASSTILDAGCGTGFYLRELGLRFASQNMIGVDVSKEAIRFCAKTIPEAAFAVCDISNRIAIKDSSVDVILSFFSPRNVVEFARILRPSGVVAILMAAPRHINELRDEFGLLEIEADKVQRTVKQMSSHFSVIHESSVEFAITLNASSVLELLTMSPNYFHRERQGWMDKSLTGDRTVTVAGSLLVLRANT